MYFRPMNASVYFRHLYNEDHIDLFVTITTIISPAALLINVYGLYAITFHSAAHLKVLKPHLLFHQVTLILVDFCIFDLGKPVLLQPIPAGYSPGLMKDWPLYVNLGILCAGLSLWALTCSTALQIILFKHTNLWPPGSRWTFSPRNRFAFCVFANVLGATAMSIPLFTNGMDSLNTKEKMRKELAFLSQLLDKPYLIAMDIDSLSFTVFVVGYGVINLIFTVTLVVLIVSTFHGLRLQKANVSRKTYEMQRRYLNILLVQLLSPIGFSFIPGMFIFMIIITRMWVPVVLISILFSLAGLHGVVGTSLSLFLNECYRRPLTEKIFYFCKVRKTSQKNLVLVVEKPVSHVSRADVWISAHK